MSERIVDYASHTDPQPCVDNLVEMLFEMTRTLVNNTEDISRGLRRVHQQSITRTWRKAGCSRTGSGRGADR